MSCIAVIPARGGSKRIPGKNSKLFLGIPIIERVINQALKSNLFDRIIVSTDDEYIAEIAFKAGADVPFLRPANIAGDHTSTITVVRHAITEMIKTKETDIVCCLYPTSVFVNAEVLKNGLSIIRTGLYDYVISSVEYDHPIQRSFTLQEGRLNDLLENHLQTRTQDLKKFYHDAGQFYCGRVKSWLSNDRIIGKNSYAIVFSGNEVHDIDTPEDWVIAELLFKISKKENL
jgi:pseudaminic acid cytidylyltransferase